MRYNNIERGTFLRRLNRFAAEVEMGGGPVRVHVKNTGRLRELLAPGARAVLARADRPGRKTAFDLVAVNRGDGRLFNIDSQAPNIVVKEWLAELGRFDEITPAYTVGNSRFDFRMMREGRPYLLEVKGCTLIRDGVGYFPDAPTERGVKHLRELTRLAGQGIQCAVGFVIQGEGCEEVLPNRETHPTFGEALDAARAAGVRVLQLPCLVTEDSLRIRPDVRW